MSSTKARQFRLERDEHIQQETARAAERGMTPRRPISIARNFRVEALVGSRSAPLPGIVVAGAARAVGAVPRGRNEKWRLPAAEVAQANVEDVLERLNGANRMQLVPELLARFGDLAAQSKGGRPFGDLQKRILAAAFGESSVAAGKGGDAREHRKR